MLKAYLVASVGTPTLICLFLTLLESLLSNLQVTGRQPDLLHQFNQRSTGFGSVNFDSKLQLTIYKLYDLEQVASPL